MHSFFGNYLTILRSSQSDTIMSLAKERTIDIITLPLNFIVDFNYIKSIVPKNTLLFSSRPCQNTIPTSNIKKILGTENQNIILELSTFNLNTILKLTGSLSFNGKMIILLTENLNAYTNFVINTSLNYQNIHTYCINNISDFNKVLFTITKLFLTPNDFNADNAPNIEYINKIILNDEQIYFKNNIIDKLDKHKLFTYLLTGNRGTGKTETIISIVNICVKKMWKVCVLNGSEGNIQSRYKSIPGIQIITTENYEQFVDKIDLLIIEEAASIIIHKLTTILKKFPVCIMVSTNIGYEGNSQGINLKLSSINIEEYTLTKNYRYQIDNCEHFLNRLQFKDSETLPTDNNSIPNEFFSDKMSNLLNKYQLLSQISELLLKYHYQETSQDIVRWLSSPNTYVVGYVNKNKLEGISIFSIEGPIPKELADDIYLGYRRPKNNLLPQSLMSHANIKEAYQYSYIRIERIAVTEYSRRLNIGSKLIELARCIACKFNIDFIGTSFAINPITLNFWVKNNFKCINIGLKKDNASGERSVLMLKSVNQKNELLCQIWERIFQNKITFILKRHNLEAEGKILNDYYLPQLNSSNKIDSNINIIKLADDYLNRQIPPLIDAIAKGNHSTEHSIYELTNYYNINKEFFITVLSNEELNFLNDYLMNYNLPNMVSKYQCTGKKEIFSKIKLILKKVRNTNE